MEDNRLESKYPADSRYDEVEKILSFIKSGNSVQVVSLPGVGRSNILRLITYNEKTRELHLRNDADKFHFVLLNFAEVKNRDLRDVTKFMFLELIESLLARGLDEEHKLTKETFDESLKNNDELVFFQGLKKTIDYLCLQKDMNIVFLFDRFEDYVPMLTPAFFDNLRVLRDRAKYKVSAVFSLNRPLEDSIGQEIISSFYEFIVGNIVYLNLGDEKIMQFREKYLEEKTGKKLPEGLASEIEKLTGGLGKLWLVSYEKTLELDDKTNLDKKLQESKRVNAVLTEIWDSFTPYEQNLIKENKAQESNHLIALGLVKNNKLAVPLLEEFAKNQTVDKLSLNEVSDELTSSENKLLKFLMENPNKILERDEVVNAVWGDLSSTAGVSEQALDQLIFRLRKKIEENPNSPTHIQTIKGRGFKFSP